MFGLNNSCRHLTKSVMHCLHPFMQLNLYIELAEKIISLIHRTCRRIHIAYTSNLQKNSYCLYIELAEEFISLIHRTCRRVHIAYTSNLQKNSYCLLWILFDLKTFCFFLDGKMCYMLTSDSFTNILWPTNVTQTLSTIS